MGRYVLVLNKMLPAFIYCECFFFLHFLFLIYNTKCSVRMHLNVVWYILLRVMQKLLLMLILKDSVVLKSKVHCDVFKVLGVITYGALTPI